MIRLHREVTCQEGSQGFYWHTVNRHSRQCEPTILPESWKQSGLHSKATVLVHARKLQRSFTAYGNSRGRVAFTVMQCLSGRGLCSSTGALRGGVHIHGRAAFSSIGAFSGVGGLSPAAADFFPASCLLVWTLGLGNPLKASRAACKEVSVIIYLVHKLWLKQLLYLLFHLSPAYWTTNFEET